MSYTGIQIQSLAFHGPDKPPAVIRFQDGLNVIYGASDTGKSYIVEAIDYMFGAKGPLKDIPQAVGYDQILLALQFSETDLITARRSMNGGAFEIFDGAYSEELPGTEGKILSEMHSSRDPDNLSAFLLGKIGLSDKKIRKNAKDETQNLSFRNLARLCIVNEEEIIQKRSPLSDGNYTADTANMSVFRLLLTGVDDSALVASKQKSPEEQRREAQLELLDQLISETERKIKKISGSKDELKSQEQRLIAAMDTRSSQLAITEDYYRRVSTDRRNLMKLREENRNRFTEVVMLLERFKLLREHYHSDIERLMGIREAGSIIATIDADVCPVCGAEAEHHKNGVSCDNDVSRVTAAASSEIEKIERRAEDLSETIDALVKERAKLEGSLPKIEENLHDKNRELQTVIAPDLRSLRTSYKELADKGANVREALGLFDTKSDLIDRKARLENTNSQEPSSSTSPIKTLTDTQVAPFSELVRKTLDSWGFPGSDRVHFDLEAKDLVISGKPRVSYGKGLRAITQAAFTISLMEYCASKDTPHPGFVFLDSPLLSYKEPEGPEDDLSKTDLNGNFYRFLLQLKAHRQVIIVENTDPPSDVELGDRVEHFSGMESEGRFGLFPVQ
jgi:hypothetical protein